jgi:hypothetical protein
MNASVDRSCAQPAAGSTAASAQGPCRQQTWIQYISQTSRKAERALNVTAAGRSEISAGGRSYLEHSVSSLAERCTLSPTALHLDCCMTS